MLRAYTEVCAKSSASRQIARGNVSWMAAKSC
jgi:hypothetical protein